MKLLLEGLFAALVLMCELVGMVALAKYTETTTAETLPPAQQGGFTTIVVWDDGGGGEAYQWVKWEGSCSAWDLQNSEGDIVEENSPEETQGGANISSKAKDCRVVNIWPHFAATRQPGVDRPTSGGHRAESTSEKSSSTRLGE